VDNTFLTEKCHGTLLVAIAQDGNRNIFPLAFAIVERSFDLVLPFITSIYHTSTKLMLDYGYRINYLVNFTI